MNKFDPPFAIQVALGLIPNYRPHSKFGLDPAATSGTNDVWDIGLVYTYIAAAVAIQLSSSHASDTEEITVEGLDANYDEISETKALTGQTGVDTTATFLRVNRMYNSDGAVLQGDVYASESGAGLTAGVPSSLADARAKITLGRGQTLQAIYTVPRNHTLVLTRGRVTTDLSGSTSAELMLVSRVLGGVFRVGQDIPADGAIDAAHDFDPPLAFSAQTDIKAQSIITGGGSNKVSASWGGYLVKVA